jgi:hypothetical protein
VLALRDLIASELEATHRSKKFNPASHKYCKCNKNNKYNSYNFYINSVVKDSTPASSVKCYQFAALG